MSQPATKVIAVSTETPDQPGTAAAMATVLRERGIGLKAAWARPSGAGATTVVSIPEKIEQLRALAAEEGRTTKETPMVWLEGPDETGALCPCLEKIGEAGINILGMTSMASGGNFATAFEFADEPTVDRVVALLGA